MPNENTKAQQSSLPGTTPEPVKKETITIERSKLEAILNRIDRLESAASKAGLAKYDANSEEGGSKSVNLGMIDGKAVISWQMTENVVEKNANNAWVERQTIQLTFEDGETMDMPYVFFARRINALPCEVIGETKVYGEEKKKYGGNLFEIRSGDGHVYKVGEKFLNPAGGPGVDA